MRAAGLKCCGQVDFSAGEDDLFLKVLPSIVSWGIALQHGEVEDDPPPGPTGGTGDRALVPGEDGQVLQIEPDPPSRDETATQNCWLKPKNWARRRPGKRCPKKARRGEVRDRARQEIARIAAEAKAGR